MFIPFQFTLANWNISIKYSTLCNCQQISDPTLCTSSQFCQLNMDFECIEVLDYNCSYFNEQTVLYLCSQLDRCYLNNELKGSTNQECYQQSNRCGTSINDICQLTQCDSYQDEGECNNSIFNIRFDNVGYGNVCYWNNYISSCENLLCENVLYQLNCISVFYQDLNDNEFNFEFKDLNIIIFRYTLCEKLKISQELNTDQSLIIIIKYNYYNQVQYNIKIYENFLINQNSEQYYKQQEIQQYQWINVYNMQIYVKLQIIYALGQLAQIYLLKIAPLYGKVLKEMPYNHVFQQMGYVRMQTVQMT